MESARFYGFGPFLLDTVNRSLLRDGELLPLQPKAYDVLLMLIKSAGRTVSREELFDAIWGLNVTEGALNYQINQARRVLGDDPTNPQYIKTFPKVGFRFIAAVTAVNEVCEPGTVRNATPLRQDTGENKNRAQKTDHRIGQSLGFLTANHALYVLSASSLYAAYFGVAVLVEIAYQFDRYQSWVKWFAPLISCFVFVCSVLGMSAGAKRTLAGKRGGLLLSGSVLVLAAAIALAAACGFLPAEPVTDASFQTFTAQAAYLKDLCYIVPLGLIFLIMPFHFIVAMQRELQRKDPVLAANLLTGAKPAAAPAGTVFLRIWFLLLLLTGMMAYSLIGRGHLFDNLKPGPYMSLFQNLIHVRMIIFFGLAILCLAWYYRALNDLRRDVVARVSPEPD